jgi:hypothetical protein
MQRDERKNCLGCRNIKEVLKGPPFKEPCKSCLKGQQFGSIEDLFGYYFKHPKK